jgi:hypothetical protein
MTTTRASRRDQPYITCEGRVLRDPATGFQTSSLTHLWKFVEWKRVAYVLFPILVLWVTNPANEINIPTTTILVSSFKSSSSSSSSSWLVVGRPRITNYGLFSLQESIEGVTVSAFLTETSLCPFNDVTIGSFCESIADSMCHRRPLLPFEYWYSANANNINNIGNSSSSMGGDYNYIINYYRIATSNFLTALATDRVHVIHRLICSILILSTIWNYCCPRFPPRRTLFDGILLFLPPIIEDILTSVFSSSNRRSNNLIRDLIHENFVVYPVLVELNRIVPKLRLTSWWVRPTGNDTADFILAVIILVFVIGGGSNVLASRISQRYVVGFSSVSAIAFGYIQRIANSNNNNNSGGFGGTTSRTATLATFGTIGRRYTINSVQAYWSNVAWLFVAYPNDWYPMLVVWLIAGLAGSIYAEFHLGNIDNIAAVYYRDLLQFFGLS